MKILEIWQKGHPSKNQTYRLVSNALGSIADVSMDDNNIVIEMLYHSFIDKFTSPGMSDKLLNMHFQLDKLDKIRLSNKEMYQKHNNEFTMAKTKFHKYYRVVTKEAIRKARSFIPFGWLLVSQDTDVNHPEALSDKKIILTVIRDRNDIEHKNEVYYHVTTKDKAMSINVKGLVPSSNNRSSFHGYRNRVYLYKHNPIKFSSQEEIAHLITGNFTVLLQKDIKTEIVVFKVTIPDGVQVYKDPESGKDVAVYIEIPIPPDNLEIIYQGRIGDIA